MKYKEEALNKNIADLGSIVYKYSKNLGTFGYVSIRGSKDEKVQGSRFMHNDNLQHNKDFARLKIPENWIVGQENSGYLMFSKFYNLKNYPCIFLINKDKEIESRHGVIR